MRHGTTIVAGQMVTPIEADWKISEVLKRYPDLLEAFIEMSPAFSRMRNAALRRVQSRLVTVRQAAGIAGIDVNDLVNHLNQAIGVETDRPEETPAVEVTAPGSERPGWADAGRVSIDLDVRPLHEKGEEPFAAIMDAVRRTPVNGVLLLRNSFDPVPLYDVLAARGLEHWTNEVSHDDWEIWFYRARTDRSKAEVETTSHDELDWSRPTAEVTIDVSELVPPEPMIKILESLESLPTGGVLLVRHVRRPMHLYPRLDDLGYRYDTHEVGPGRVEVLIEKSAGDGREGA